MNISVDRCNTTRAASKSPLLQRRPTMTMFKEDLGSYKGFFQQLHQQSQSKLQFYYGPYKEEEDKFKVQQKNMHKKQDSTTLQDLYMTFKEDEGVEKANQKWTDIAGVILHRNQNYLEKLVDKINRRDEYEHGKDKKLQFLDIKKKKSRGNFARKSRGGNYTSRSYRKGDRSRYSSKQSQQSSKSKTVKFGDSSCTPMSLAVIEDLDFTEQANCSLTKKKSSNHSPEKLDKFFNNLSALKHPKLRPTTSQQLLNVIQNFTIQKQLCKEESLAKLRLKLKINKSPLLMLQKQPQLSNKLINFEKRTGNNTYRGPSKIISAQPTNSDFHPNITTDLKTNQKVSNCTFMDLSPVQLRERNIKVYDHAINETNQLLTQGILQRRRSASRNGRSGSLSTTMYRQLVKSNLKSNVPSALLFNDTRPVGTTYSHTQYLPLK